jgi:hypothetical protein
VVVAGFVVRVVVGVVVGFGLVLVTRLVGLTVGGLLVALTVGLIVGG